MTGDIWLTGSVVYPVGWLVIARLLYGRWRYEEIDRGGSFPECRLYHGDYRGKRDCCARHDANRVPVPSVWISAIACAVAIVWPAVLLVLAVIAKPREHPKEIEARRAKQRALIAELEQDLEKSRKALED